MDWTKEDVKAYMEKYNCSECEAYQGLGMNEGDIDRYTRNRLMEYLENLLKLFLSLNLTLLLLNSTK